jgi:Ketopantoate hydroxymethyltransferase
VAPQVRALVQAGIPVMGHLGLTPQSVNAPGGYRVQGEELLADAQALQDAGVFALVLEAIPADLAGRVTETLEVPTIGIGAGPHCDRGRRRGCRAVRGDAPARATGPLPPWGGLRGRRGRAASAARPRCAGCSGRMARC